MAFVYTSPREWEDTGGLRYPHLFLAGGISHCPEWQKEAISLLSDLEIRIFNPRREYWNMNAGPEESRDQILWEHKYLQQADWILFWFPEETDCPITLFELGKYLVSNKNLFIGMHPNYNRRLDVIEQCAIERPFMQPVFSLKELCHNVEKHAKAGV
jgi:hypothetical protein